MESSYSKDIIYEKNESKIEFNLNKSELKEKKVNQMKT